MPEQALFGPLCAGLLADGVSVRFQASGVSMHPAIRNGDTVVVRASAAADVRRGDVLLYRGRRGLTAHRVVEILGEGRAPVFILRGDNAAGRERVEPEHALGKVVCVERGRLRFDPGSIWMRSFSRCWRALSALRRAALVAGGGAFLSRTNKQSVTRT
jgi:hypothetical protein